MKEFVVIGLGRFGASVARTLYGLGNSVLGVDTDEAKVQAMVHDVTHVVQADATDETVLQSLGLANFDVAVVAIGNDMEASILVTLLLKELQVPYVVAKAASESHGKVLQRIGADRVVFPERDMGVRVANNLVASSILDHIELTADISVVELTANHRIDGKSLRELDLRAKYGVTVLAIKRGRKIEVSPSAEEKISHKDVLVAIGHNDNLRKFEAMLEK